MEYDSLSRCLDGEMVDTRDSKSRAEERGGSSPLQGIIWRMLIQWAFPVEVFRKSGPGALLYLLRSLTISLRKVDSKSQNRLNIYSLNDPKNPSKEIIKNQSRWYPTARVVLRIQKRLLRRDKYWKRRASNSERKLRFNTSHYSNFLEEMAFIISFLWG